MRRGGGHVSYADFCAQRVRSGELGGRTTQLLGVPSVRPRPRPTVPPGPPPASFELPVSLCARAAAAREAEQLGQVQLKPPPTTSDKPNFEAMKSETPPGCCIVCEKPLNSKAKKLLCGAEECHGIYVDTWRHDRDANRRASREASGRPVRVQRLRAP